MCGKGLTWSSGGFHNTGQGQVRLPVSPFRFLSPSFSPLFSLFPFFCISFLLFACVCGGGVGIAVIWGVSPILGKDKSFSFFLLSSSFSLHFYLFLLLCSSFCLSLLLHCWCVWRGGVGITVDELYCQNQDLEICTLVCMQAKQMLRMQVKQMHY